jgi:hypothetical protein
MVQYDARPEDPSDCGVHRSIYSFRPVTLSNIGAYAVVRSSISQSCRFMLYSVRGPTLLPLNLDIGSNVKDRVLCSASFGHHPPLTSNSDSRNPRELFLRGNCASHPLAASLLIGRLLA